MKKLVTGVLLMMSLPIFAQSVSYDRDLFVEVTSSVNPSTGTVTERMYGTLAYESAHEENSFTSVFLSASGYVYFNARERGVNFSCYAHESVHSATQMENFKTMVAAFNNGSRIRVTKFGHQNRCNDAYFYKGSWQHLN